MLKFKILQFLLGSSIPRYAAPKLLEHVKRGHIYNDVHMIYSSHHLNLHSKVIVPEQPFPVNQCKIALPAPSPKLQHKNDQLLICYKPLIYFIDYISHLKLVCKLLRAVIFLFHCYISKSKEDACRSELLYKLIEQISKKEIL